MLGISIPTELPHGTKELLINTPEILLVVSTQELLLDPFRTPSSKRAQPP